MQTEKPRPYSFARLINSLASPTQRDNSASWERGLGERAAACFKQASNRSEREQAAFVPPARMVRDLLTTPAGSGGDLIGESVLRVSQSIRPATVLERAGVERLEVSGDNLTLPRFAPASAGWVEENGTFPSLSTTVISVDATPRMAAARLAYSRRLQVLSDGVEDVVLAEVAAGVGALIEQGCLTGSGTSGQPLGLLRLPNALNQSFSAPTPSSDELASMLELLGDQNVDLSRVRFVMHPSTAADLMRQRVDSSSGTLVLSYADSAYRIHGVPVLMTTAITQNKVLAFDPAYLRMVFFGAAQVIVDPYRGAVNGETHIQIVDHMDLVCTYQSSVCVGSA